MKVPGIIAMNSLRVNDTEYEAYSDYVNGIVKRISTRYGTESRSDNPAGIRYYYADNYFKLIYLNSFYGNDNFQVHVSEDYWADIPTGINPMMVNEDGWNYVYQAISAKDRKVITFHIPGKWVEMLNYDG